METQKGFPSPNLTFPLIRSNGRSPILSKLYMKNVIFGKKLNMTQVFTEQGVVIPVTAVKATPMTVVQVKTKSGKDGYDAIQVGVSKQISGSKKVKSPQKGHVKAAGTFGKLAEFRLDDASSYQVGQKLDLSGFQIGEVISVQGTMKGRGFAGAMKRHGFSGFPASHGHDKPRSVGSIGGRFPQHVHKGKRMAGHMGSILSTAKNLQVVDVDVHKGILLIKGSIPGPNTGTIKITSTGKVKPLVKVVVVKEDKKKK